MSQTHILWTDKPLASGQPQASSSPDRETSRQSGADPDEGQLTQFFLRGELRDWFMDVFDEAVRIETGNPLHPVLEKALSDGIDAAIKTVYNRVYLTGTLTDEEHLVLFRMVKESNR